MKPATLILSLIAFLATCMVNAQQIEANETWPLLAENSASEKTLEEEFEELDGEIDDLEDIALDSDKDEMFLDATLIEDDKPKKRVRKKVRKAKRPKRKVRKIVRKRTRPKTRSRTIIAKLPPLPKKRSTLFHLSPVFGMSFTKMTGGLIENSFVNNTDNTFGIRAGVLAEYRKDRSIWGIETGLTYMQVGVLGDNNFTTTFGGRLDFIENEYLYIPLNAKLYPLRLDKFELSIKAGIMGGFLMSSLTEATAINGLRISRDTSSFFKGQDFQANIGLGARGKISRDFGLGLDVTYHKGLVDISNALTMATLTGGTFNTQNLDSEAKNEGFSIMGTIVIDI